MSRLAHGYRGPSLTVERHYQLGEVARDASRIVEALVRC